MTSPSNSLTTSMSISRELRSSSSLKQYGGTGVSPAPLITCVGMYARDSLSASERLVKDLREEQSIASAPESINSFDDLVALARFHYTEDLHAARAAHHYGVHVRDVTPEQRRFAKKLNYWLMYGN